MLLFFLTEHNSLFDLRLQQFGYRCKRRDDHRITELAVSLGIGYRNTKLVTLRRLKPHQASALSWR